jgi:hypothetical protein
MADSDIPRPLQETFGELTNTATLMPPLSDPSQVQGQRLIPSTLMIEGWLYQHYSNIKKLLIWHDAKCRVDLTFEERRQLRARVERMCLAYNDRVEVKLEGTRWSGMGLVITNDSIARSKTLPSSGRSQREILSSALRLQLKKREKKHGVEKEREEVGIIRTWQEEKALERWLWLQHVGEMRPTEEYEEAYEKYVEESTLKDLDMIETRMDKREAELVEMIRQWQEETWEQRWQLLEDVHRSGTAFEFEVALSRWIQDSTDPGEKLSEELERMDLDEEVFEVIGEDVDNSGTWGDTTEDETQAERIENVCVAGLYLCKCVAITRR